MDRDEVRKLCVETIFAAAQLGTTEFLVKSAAEALKAGDLEKAVDRIEDAWLLIGLARQTVARLKARKEEQP